MIASSSTESEVDGTTASGHVSGAGNHARVQDVALLARAGHQAGARQDGRHAQSEDRLEAGEVGAGEQAHLGGRAARRGSFPDRAAEPAEESSAGGFFGEPVEPQAGPARAHPEEHSAHRRSCRAGCQRGSHPIPSNHRVAPIKDRRGITQFPRFL